MDSTGSDTRRKVILAGLIGNVMEWFDFAVYGYFASIIGTHFFPSENPTVSLIAAFGAFAAGSWCDHLVACCSVELAICWGAIGR